MDGRRVRSLSCGAGAGRRGLRQLQPVDSQPPIQSENPFNNAELMQDISADTNKVVKNLVNGFRSSYNMNDNDDYNYKVSANNKENKSSLTMSHNGYLIKGEDKGISATKPVTSEVKKVNLREKKQRGTSGSGAGSEAGVNNGGKERRERVTKSLILETDFSESVPSTTLTNSGNQIKYFFFILLMKTSLTNYIYFDKYKGSEYSMFAYYHFHDTLG